MLRHMGVSEKCYFNIYLIGPIGKIIVIQWFFFFLSLSLSLPPAISQDCRKAVTRNGNWIWGHTIFQTNPYGVNMSFCLKGSKGSPARLRHQP